MTARNPVVCLQPCTRPATHVARADLLGDDAFEVDLARATKDGGPVFGDRLAWWTGACRGSTFRAGEVRHIALPPYSLVITHVCYHESEYSHLSPRTLAKLAKLVADKVSAGEKDPIRIRDGALADLKGYWVAKR